jgi:hypothetical protein
MGAILVLPDEYSGNDELIMEHALPSNPQLPMKQIIRTWWPLAASWLLMGMELPALTVVIARLPNPIISLAAYGGVVFPLAMIIEAPIIMLLSASTALSKDWNSYRIVRTYMMVAGASLTLLHVLVAFSPLYYVIVQQILNVPEEIVEPARIGLMIMTPWTWSIAYRRFNQGVLIRFGHSQSVGVGTVIRLSADCLVLALGYSNGTISGIVVATSAVIAGVVCEAIYSGIIVRPVVSNYLKTGSPIYPPLTWPKFWNFYIPLAMTSLLTLLVNPLGSAALSRMPNPLASLAAWPVMSGLVFLFRSVGIAYNEVVVALLDEPRSYPNLRKFCLALASVTTLGLLLLLATPLSGIWLRNISALTPELANMARTALWITLPLPALSVYQSWFQGAILHSGKTSAITEAVLIYLTTITIMLTAGVVSGEVIGLYIGALAMTVSISIQTGWLWLRSRSVLTQIRQRDSFKLQGYESSGLAD